VEEAARRIGHAVQRFRTVPEGEQGT